MPRKDADVRICIVGCGAVGSLFAANLAQLEDVEVWAFDLAREHVEAINRTAFGCPGPATSSDACAPHRGLTSFRDAISESSPPRRCTPQPLSPPPRMRS
jgi:2-dehydropantoate 2-reductase